ncbi:Pnap_2097 family protein [Agrobacterium vitis]|nr:Pnap_2097 family protein [Agrobacterium vitis]
MERALDPYMLMGMPHLTPFGLSETWLMKELGHRHWLMLAREMGLANADFRAADGTEAYAAIRSTSFSSMRLDAVSANDVLEIRSILEPVSRTQTATKHRIMVEKNLICEASLLSVFVCRTKANDNHSIARVRLTALANYGRTQTNKLVELVSSVRAGIHNQPDWPWSNQNQKTDEFRFRPTSTQEFNGAKLFYFAEFQAVFERALEAVGGSDFRARAPSARDIVFLGNIEVGEEITVTLSTDRSDRASGWIRRTDGKQIAFISSSWNCKSRELHDRSPIEKEG